MVGGRFFCLFACIVALFLWTCLHDVEASVTNPIIHKKVGDTVELSSGLPTEGVTMALWKYGDIRLADKTGVISGNHQFQSRLEFNLTTFSLTVRKLTLQDSGDFSFISGDKDRQRPTVFIPLKVHEAITEQPILTSRNIQSFLNGSCVVLLECKAASNVSYSLTVRNQTSDESRLQYTINPQDGGITFSCTVSNVVSQKSASKRVTCDPSEEAGQEFFMWILIGAGGILVLLIIIVPVGVCCCRRRHEGSDLNELTVYADISDVVPDKTPCDLKPCSLYETIDNVPALVADGRHRGKSNGTMMAAAMNADPQQANPQTVYDRIQLNRLRKTSVSPYQEVS